MKHLLYILCLFALLLSEERTEVILRFPTGEKMVVVKYKGTGLDEEIIERYTFDIKGNVVQYEDLIYTKRHPEILTIDGLKEYLLGYWESEYEIDGKKYNSYIRHTDSETTVIYPHFHSWTEPDRCISNRNNLYNEIIAYIDDFEFLNDDEYYFNDILSNGTPVRNKYKRFDKKLFDEYINDINTINELINNCKNIHGLWFSTSDNSYMNIGFGLFGDFPEFRISSNLYYNGEYYSLYPELDKDVIELGEHNFSKDIKNIENPTPSDYYETKFKILPIDNGIKINEMEFDRIVEENELYQLHKLASYLEKDDKKWNLFINDKFANEWLFDYNQYKINDIYKTLNDKRKFTAITLYAGFNFVDMPEKTETILDSYTLKTQGIKHNVVFYDSENIGIEHRHGKEKYLFKSFEIIDECTITAKNKRKEYTLKRTECP